jgi:GMC oxidoreductase
MHPAADAILWAPSPDAEPGNLDLHVSATHLFDPAQSPTGGAIVLAVALTQPASTGRVRLADRDPRSAPIIQYNLLGTPRDMRRMIEGVHISRRIGREPAFRAVAETEMPPGPAVTDDTALRHAIIEHIDVYHHATSTVAMGREGDGVVDALGRVHGTEALTVADASIMPLVPSAPTNLTAMMIAEHVARRAFAAADPHAAAHPSRLLAVVPAAPGCSFWCGKWQLGRSSGCPATSPAAAGPAQNNSITVRQPAGGEVPVSGELVSAPSREVCRARPAAYSSGAQHVLSRQPAAGPYSAAGRYTAAWTVAMIRVGHRSARRPPRLQVRPGTAKGSLAPVQQAAPTPRGSRCSRRYTRCCTTCTPERRPNPGRLPANPARTDRHQSRSTSQQRPTTEEGLAPGAQLPVGGHDDRAGPGERW